MNRKISTLLMLLVAATIAITFSECKKDELCKVRITCCQSATGIDTGAVIPMCEVNVGKPYHADYAHTSGVTNEAGVFEYTFKLEALLDIEAHGTVPEVVNGDTVHFGYAGIGRIKLVPGETVEKTILLLKE